MNKKGQAAMEFLMTYGWAILVVLAAIGALAYFGVLSPDKFLPERCAGAAGLDCVEKASITSSATAGTISFALKNNLGHNINLTYVIDGSTDTSSCDSPTSATVSVAGATAVALSVAAASPSDITVNNGQAFTVTVTCGAISEGRSTADFSLAHESLDTYLVSKAAISIRGKATA
ncbi:hypothetical protein JXA85_04090 [Candidatus Woesearchaeota archaeon]|nr:hypothetical protein [Candidatus Woesearchaeota archaeon]